MERSMEVYGPPVKRRRVSHPHRVNHSESNKEPNLLPPNGSTDISMACIDEATATVSPADMPNIEMVVKQDDTFNNGKESLTEGSQIDCFALEQESEKNKDKIVMEGSESSTTEDRSHPSDKNTELKMDVVNSITKMDAVKENSSEARNEDNCHSHPRKKLLVLDVNGLIVDIVADPDEAYRADTIIGSKSVYKRPYCDEFLNFCFERFNVGVWTSRTRRNIERVLDFLIKDTQHQLLFCWDQSHCTETGFNTIENSDKPLVLKELKKLWEKQDPNLPWEKGVYDESNTFLLDDSPYKALRNPPNTAIFPYTYSYRNTQDNGLGPKGDLRNYLEKLAASDNVQKFIQQNPFGQQPISYNNESWKFYLKVIGDSATCPQQEADASKSCFRKKLLVIDVSGLLADVVSLPRERYKADTILQYKADTILPGSRAVFKRPYCDEFLQFCFDRFKVGMWASTSRFHTERVLDFLMRDTQHKLLFSWDLSDCTDTGFRTVENMNRPLVLKQPASIGKLPNMILLDLSKNQFPGPIPPSIRNLSTLETLRIHNNKLAGEIPTWLFEIKTLKNLFIGGKESNLIWNNKAKIVPRCSLQQLSMSSCRISGEIPEWISSQKDLIFLDLSENQLEGGFPDWLAEMEFEGIVLSDNNLTGPLPPRLFESMSLLILALSRNNFSGELPENIGNAKGIMVLMLSDNNFSGQIPKSMASIFLLMLLDLSKNKFSGDSFPIFRDTRHLVYVDLSYNDFSGKIPMNFSLDTRILSLGGNRFSGDLPMTLTKFVNLEHLDLHANEITGNFQDILPQIPTLQVLSLRNNSVEGFIPRTISNITSLRILDLSGNNLIGSIPPEIANLSSMIKTPQMSTSDYILPAYVTNVDIFNNVIEFQDLIVNWKKSFQGLASRNLDIYSLLDLSENQISGEIPASLGNLKSLKVLNVSHNRISGQIPVSFGDLRDVESLDFSYNELSGLIPQTLSKLDQLTILDVSNNRLTGKIPMGGQMDTMNELDYFQNNNGLCGMQIGIICPEDIPPPEENKEEDDKELWFLWEGTWVGFPVGFFSSILVMGYFLNFLNFFKFW